MTTTTNTTTNTTRASGNESTSDPGLPRTRTTGVRRRLFARIWTSLDGPVDEQVTSAKADVLGQIEGPIVEIGAGHGSNFPRYPRGTAVTAFEPNTYMTQPLTAAATEAGIHLDHRTCDLREAGLATGSVATVVSVLTLCSVEDRAGLIAEIHRILEPGGRLLFIEHVAETSNRHRRRFQRLIRPAWRTLFDGCDPCADTDALIAAAGFSQVRATTANLGPGADPTNLTHWGVATK